MSTFGERFWDRLCGFRRELFVLLVLDLLLLVVALVSLPFIDRGTASGVLVRIDVVLFTLGAIPLAYVQYRCRRRTESA